MKVAILRADRTRARIREAAAKIFREKGYHRGTPKEIADEAGVGVGSLYRHFESKEGLFFASVEGIKNRFDDALRKVLASDLHPGEKLVGLVDNLFQLYSENRDAFHLLLRSRYETPELETLCREMEEMHFQGIRSLVQEARGWAAIKFSLDGGILENLLYQLTSFACFSSMVEGRATRPEVAVQQIQSFLADEVVRAGPQ